MRRLERAAHTPAWEPIDSPGASELLAGEPAAGSPVDRVVAIQADVEASRCAATAAADWPTGTPLDELLPAGGWRQGTLVEWLSGGMMGAGCGRWLCVVAGGCSRRTGGLLLIDMHGECYPPGLAGLGVPLPQVIVVRPGSVREGLWACEQALRCPGVGVGARGVCEARRPCVPPLAIGGGGGRKRGDGAAAPLGTRGSRLGRCAVAGDAVGPLQTAVGQAVPDGSHGDPPRFRIIFVWREGVFRPRCVGGGASSCSPGGSRPASHVGWNSTMKRLLCVGFRADRGAARGCRNRVDSQQVDSQPGDSRRGGDRSANTRRRVAGQLVAGSRSDQKPHHALPATGTPPPAQVFRDTPPPLERIPHDELRLLADEATRFGPLVALEGETPPNRSSSTSPVANVCMGANPRCCGVRRHGSANVFPNAGAAGHRGNTRLCVGGVTHGGAGSRDRTAGDERGRSNRSPSPPAVEPETVAVLDSLGSGPSGSCLRCRVPASPRDGGRGSFVVWTRRSANFPKCWFRSVPASRRDGVVGRSATGRPSPIDSTRLREMLEPLVARLRDWSLGLESLRCELREQVPGRGAVWPLLSPLATLSTRLTCVAGEKGFCTRPLPWTHSLEIPLTQPTGSLRHLWRTAGVAVVDRCRWRRHPIRAIRLEGGGPSRTATAIAVVRCGGGPVPSGAA